MKVGDLVRPVFGEPPHAPGSLGIIIGLEREFLYSLVHVQVFWSEHAMFWHEMQRLEVISEKV